MATRTRTTSSVSTSTSTDSSATPTEPLRTKSSVTIGGREYPELDLVKQAEVDPTSGGRSSPVSAVRRIGDDRVMTIGSGEVGVYSLSPFSKTQSVIVPRANNYGQHALTVVDGEGYAICGGPAPAIKRVHPSEGIVWEFQEEFFGTGRSRNVGTPGVTGDFVAFNTYISGEGGPDGESNTVAYVLDRETGEQIERLNPDKRKDGPCYMQSVAATDGKVVFGGCDGGYDLVEREYTGDTDRLNRAIRARDGVIHSGYRATEASTGERLWRVSEAGTEKIDFSENFVYGLDHGAVWKVDPDDGTMQWRVTFERGQRRPRYLTSSDERAWVSVVEDGTADGYVLAIESGEIVGGFQIDPQKTNFNGNSPYDLLLTDSGLVVGSRETVLKYTVP